VIAIAGSPSLPFTGSAPSGAASWSHSCCVYPASVRPGEGIRAAHGWRPSPGQSSSSFAAAVVASLGQVCHMMCESVVHSGVLSVGPSMRVQQTTALWRPSFESVRPPSVASSTGSIACQAQHVLSPALTATKTRSRPVELVGQLPVRRRDAPCRRCGTGIGGESTSASVAWRAVRRRSRGG